MKFLIIRFEMIDQQVDVNTIEILKRKEILMDKESLDLDWTFDFCLHFDPAELAFIYT